MMDFDWSILRCEECRIILGYRMVIDEDGVMEFCKSCGVKHIDFPEKGNVQDWKYGKGWFSTTMEQAEQQEKSEHPTW